MELGLKSDLAVVVGAAQGIGLAIAVRFAEEGAAVALVDRDPLVHDPAAKQAAMSPGPVCGFTCDATDYAAVTALVAEIREKMGCPRHVVYAAGSGSGKYGYPFWNLEPQDWPRVLNVNLLGAVNVAHAFAPSLIEAGQSSLLMIASIAGQIGSQTDPPYSAAKAGLINFMQCAAKDLGPFGVRVNAVSPGMVKTTLNRSVWEAWNSRQPVEAQQDYETWAAEKIRRVSPLGRWQTPADIAAVSVFLASPRAANITGQTINVDGGQVMHA